MYRENQRAGPAPFRAQRGGDAPAQGRGDIGKLEADPFVDAQDWDIERVDVMVRHPGPDKATATVSFRNVGKQRTVFLDLVKLREGWRIADVTRDRNATLRGVLTRK